MWYLSESILFNNSSGTHFHLIWYGNGVYFNDKTAHDHGVVRLFLDCGNGKYLTPYGRISLRPDVRTIWKWYWGKSISFDNSNGTNFHIFRYGNTVYFNDKQLMIMASSACFFDSDNGKHWAANYCISVRPDVRTRWKWYWGKSIFIDNSNGTHFDIIWYGEDRLFSILKQPSLSLQKTPNWHVKMNFLRH